MNKPYFCRDVFLTDWRHKRLKNKIDLWIFGKCTEFDFASIHMNTSKELTEHWSEIFNRNEISYRFEFILSLMWTYSNSLKLEYVHMRGEMNSNRHEISFRLKISLRCSVSSLLVFTWIEVKWTSKRYGFYIGHFDRNDISNRHEIFMWT